MKVLQLTYSVLLLALVGLLAACSSDDIAEEQPNGTDVATLTLRIGTPEATAVTRAAGSTYGNWNDAKNATKDRLEMMYNWYVVIVDAQNKVVYVKEKTTVPQNDAEIDIVEEKVTLAAGNYTAYNFANIAKTALPTTLQNAAVGSTLDVASLEAATFAVNGNNFTPSASNGIPMSNKQPLTIAASDTEKDLIVVRMLAKMEIRLYNETGAAVKVTRVLLSDVTKNPTDNENAANLKLLPAWTTTDATAGPNNMKVTEHGGLQPNVAATADTAAFVYTVPTDKQTAAPALYDENNDGTPGDPARVYTFYINETKKPANAFQRFTLTIETEVTTTNPGGGTTTTHLDQRFALIDDSNVRPDTNSDDATDDQGKWDYIARNDYRIIPVVLDDYRLELVPYDFPAIGVYPASVKEEDGRFTINFHDYGHFHLVPYVTKISTGESVPFGSADTGKPFWTLNTDFPNSWKTYTELNGTPLPSGNTATTQGTGEFYRIESTPVTVDGDEVGGVPVWYDNTTSPQWSPKGDGNYPPFIFGYIEDPEVAGGEYWDAGEYKMTKDKSIYHEFTVTLNRGNGTNRLLKAGVLMILDKDQVLYARSTARGPRRLHSCH